MAHVVNIRGHNYLLEIGTSAGRKPHSHNMAPGEVVDVDDAYGLRRVPSEGRDPLPAIVEQMSNGAIIPANDPRAKPFYDAWLEKQSTPAIRAATVSTAGVDTPIEAGAKQKGR